MFIRLATGDNFLLQAVCALKYIRQHGLFVQFKTFCCLESKFCHTRYSKRFVKWSLDGADLLRKWAEDEPEVIAEADDGRDNGGQAEGCEHLVDESPLLVRAEVLEPDRPVPDDDVDSQQRAGDDDGDVLRRPGTNTAN